MEKFAHFILKRRNLLFTSLAMVAVICAYLMSFVVVNHDMTLYLPEDSNVRAGITVMEEAFGDLNTSDLHVMFEGISDIKATVIYEQLSEFEHVTNVMFDPESDAHVRDDFTLYTLSLQQGLSADEEYALVHTILEVFSPFAIEMSGDVEGVDIDLNMMLITVPTVIILIIILFAMCRSWVEPVLLFINIGIAIFINMGTNMMFESISDITQMIAGLLQVALSMDYSIIFLNRYRQEKEAMEVEDHKLAMQHTIRNSFSTISGISFTTIVGMLMLVFMSFTIGADIGFVIAKGVFISLVCVFGVMPALILWFDTLIDKTAKPVLSLKMGAVGRFSYRARYVVSLLFIILFAGAFVLQNQIEITYSEVDYDPIHQVFDLENTFVVLYENTDEENMATFISELELRSSALGDPNWVLHEVVSIYSYQTTLGQSLTESELAAFLEMDEMLVGLVFRNYFLETLPTITLEKFLAFLQGEVAGNAMFATTMTAEELEQLSSLPQLMEQQILMQVFTAEALADVLQMDPDLVHQMLQMHGDHTVSLGVFLQLLQETGAMSLEELAHLEALPALMVSEMMAEELTTEALATTLQMDVSIISQLLYLHEVIHGEMLTEEMTLIHFIDYLVTDFAQIPMFEASFSNETLAELERARLEMLEAGEMFVSDSFSRMMVNTTFDFESEVTFTFMDQMIEELDDLLEGRFYLLGTSAMPHEMRQTFPDEYSFITFLTTVAFFIVAAISFKSMAVSAILAIAIQAAVFITMGATYFQDGGIMFLPLIIAQVLLKSRVIDYGILYTANYIEARKKYDVKEAIISALNRSIDTILTSGLIIVLVTFVVGLIFMGVNVAISEILLLIAQGCFIGIMLSIFVLPSLIAVFDRFVTKAKTKGH